MQATLDSPIKVNNILVDVFYNGMNVWSFLFDGGNYTTSFDFKTNYTIDSLAPHGNYGLNVTLHSSDGDVYFLSGCASGKWTM